MQRNNTSNAQINAKICLKYKSKFHKDESKMIRSYNSTYIIFKNTQNQNIKDLWNI